MHRMLEAVSAQMQRHPHGWETSAFGHSSTWGGVSRLELIETLASEERKRVEMESAGGPIADRVEQAATVAALASAVRMYSVEVSAWAVVSTYDPQGGFRPGQQVTWSGHLSRAEAERAVPLWEQYLNRRRDPMHVEYRSVRIHMMRRNGWTGPQR